jgi:hypothetical protein
MFQRLEALSRKFVAGCQEVLAALDKFLIGLKGGYQFLKRVCHFLKGVAILVTPGPVGRGYWISSRDIYKRVAPKLK